MSAIAPITTTPPAAVPPPAAPTPTPAAAATSPAIAPATPAANPAAPGATPPAAAAPASPDAKPRSDVFADLARKDRQLVARERALKAAETELAEAKSDAQLRAADPVAYMRKHGISYEELTRRMLAAGAAPAAEDPIKKLEQKVVELESSAKKREAVEQEKAVEAARSAYVANVEKFVGSKGEEFELIGRRKAFDLVETVTLEHYKQTGEIMPMAEACGLVENHLLEEAKTFLDAVKIKKIASAPPAAEKKPDAPSTPAAEGGLQTLTNGQAARAGEAPPRRFKNDDEHIAWIASQTKLFKEQ